MATLEENVASILSGVNDISSTTSSRLDSVISLLADIRGETPDIRAKVTNVKIERIYIGDRPAKRAQAEEQLAKLISNGYRPYMFLGLSEDLARYVFVKYTGNNAPVV